MQVCILVSIASAEWSYVPGQIVEMDDDLARTWISSGLAAPADNSPDPAEEAAAAPRKRNRK